MGTVPKRSEGWSEGITTLVVCNSTEFRHSAGEVREMFMEEG